MPTMAPVLTKTRGLSTLPPGATGVKEREQGRCRISAWSSGLQRNSFNIHPRLASYPQC